MHIPPIQRHVRDALSGHSNVANLSLVDQWRQLVLRPLTNLDDGDVDSPYVIVIDALDECEGERFVPTILQLLTEAGSLRRVRLRVILTSRPEVPIRIGFCQIPNAEHHDFILHDVEATIVNQDISLFIDYELKRIGQRQTFEPGWPSEQAISLLVSKACGLFIWAATACRIIDEGEEFGPERLDDMLQADAVGTAPDQHLDDIYLTVLKNSISQHLTDKEKERRLDGLSAILGTIVVLFSTLSANALTTLLCMPKLNIDRTLQRLHAVLNVPEDRRRPLQLHHPSFRDFLLDIGRCRDPSFQVDEKQAHQTLAKRCLQLMSTSLKRNVCGVDAPGASATDVMEGHIQDCLPLEVQYACTYWVQHLQKSGAQFHDRILEFLREHFLHWLEALGWMRKTSEGVLAIHSLKALPAVTLLVQACENIH